MQETLPMAVLISVCIVVAIGLPIILRPAAFSHCGWGLGLH